MTRAYGAATWRNGANEAWGLELGDSRLGGEVSFAPVSRAHDEDEDNETLSHPHIGLVRHATIP